MPTSSDRYSHVWLGCWESSGDFVTIPSYATSPGKRPCSSLTRDGKPCRASAVVDGKCRVHAGLLDMRAIGAKGGRARGSKSKQLGKAGVREALRRRFERDPDAVADRLLSAGAKGAEILWLLSYGEPTVSAGASAPTTILVNSCFPGIGSLADLVDQLSRAGCPMAEAAREWAAERDGTRGRGEGVPARDVQESRSSEVPNRISPSTPDVDLPAPARKPRLTAEATD